MTNWISVIENYIHTEVIEVEWTNLKKSLEIQHVGDFISIHAKFLDNVAKKCFLTQVLVVKRIFIFNYDTKNFPSVNFHKDSIFIGLNSSEQFYLSEIFENYSPFIMSRII